MIEEQYVRYLETLIPWLPNCDATSDPAGSNAHFKKYFSPEESCLEADLSDYNVYSNFPFKIGFKFVDKFE